MQIRKVALHCLIALFLLPWTSAQSLAQTTQPTKTNKATKANKATTPLVVPPCPHQTTPPPCKARPLPPHLRPLSFPKRPNAIKPKAAPQKRQPPDIQGLLQYLRKVRKTEKIPGISIAVVSAQHSFSGGVGFRDLQKKQPVTAKTLFAIGSNTKAFTATALAILADRKKLRWHRPIREYLHDFRLHDDYATQKLNTIDLLAHRSGLPRHDLVWYGSPLSRKQLYQRLRHLKPSTSFRGRYQYQNLMYMTAGILLERISGLSWEKFLEKELLTPLKMTQSGLGKDTYHQAKNKALPYAFDEKKQTHKAVPYRDIDAIGPAGSIVSNAEDMARWVQFQLNYSLHRKPPILSRKGFWMLHTPHNTVTASPYLSRFTEISYMSYGMGWLIMKYRGDRMILHTGGIDGFTAIVSFLPQRNLGLVLLTNQGGYGHILPLLWESYDILLRRNPTPWLQRFHGLKKYIAQAQLQKQKRFLAMRIKNAPHTHPLAAFVGDYKHPAYGNFRIESKKGQLFGHYHSFTQPVPLRHYHYNTFHVVDPDTNKVISRFPIQFHLSASGKIRHLAVPLEPTIPPIKFRRTPKKK